MATNLPVITVNVGDAVDLIHESDGNYIVARDVDAIAAIILEVCRRGERSHGRMRLIPSIPSKPRRKRVLELYSQVARA